MINRRRFLGQLALGAAAVPVLRPILSFAQAAQPPRRVVILCSPNGPQHVVGPTEGTELDFNILPWWRPLERHKSSGLFFHRCHQPGVPFGTHNEYGHQSGSVGALTATTTQGTNSATGPSLDQFIAKELEKRGVVTPKRSLLWGLHDNANGSFYEAAGKRLVPISNPFEALADITRTIGDGSGPSPRLVRKHFVLDRLAGDCARLRGQLTSEGREMLDFHCGNIESLEKSVARSMDAAQRACTVPDAPRTSLGESAAWTGREARDEAMTAFTDLMALAFTCDVTRVIGVSLGNEAARFAIPESYAVPASDVVDSGDSGPQMHAWTHQPSASAAPALELFYNWFSSKVMDIVDKLATTMDADGRPLLESTLVLWTSEFGAGGPHSNDNVPVVLFGNSMGAYRTGRHFEAAGSSEDRALVLHQLFVSIARHMGLADVDRFGNAGRGPLEWLQG